MDGWSDGQAEADSLERQKHELLELLGDVPLIAATTVAVSQLAARRMASPSVGEKGYLPLNTLNKVNRKRAQKGEKREERRRGEETAASSDAQCGRAGGTGTGTARSRPSFAESFVNWGWGCTMLGRHRRQAATTDERERERGWGIE